MPAMLLAHVAILAASLALSTETIGRAQLLPVGEFAARDGRPGPGKTWKLSDAQGEALAARVNRVASQTPIVIDYEHQTLTAMQQGHKAPAAGWIRRVEWLAGKGLFADVDWTPAARAHIEGKEYLYISPVITYDDAGQVTGLALAALVNFPALLGMEPALASALSAFSTRSAPFTTAQESTVTLLAALISGLALKAEATEADVIAAVAALKAQVAAPKVPEVLATSLKLKPEADMTAACTAVAALVATESSATQTIAALQAQIATLQATAAGDEVASLVERALADGKLLPAQKDWAMSLGRKDVAALKGFIGSAPTLAPGATQTQGDPTGGGKPAALSGQQVAVFAAFGIKPDDAKKYLADKAAA